MEFSNNDNKKLEILNNKFLEIMNDGGVLATYLMSLLSKITNPENSSQFELVKDSNSNRVNNFKIDKTIPITIYIYIYINLSTFRDTDKEFEQKGDFLKMITNKNYNVGLANLSDKKLMYDFAKEMNFDLKAQGNKSTRDRTLIKLPKSPAIIASGATRIFLSENPGELCNRLSLLLQERQAGNNSNIINDETIAIVDKILEYKCMSRKKQKQLLVFFTS